MNKMALYSRIYKMENSKVVVVYFGHDFIKNHTDELDGEERWMTTCIIKTASNNRKAQIFSGTAIQHPNESTDMEMGRKISFERAVDCLVLSHLKEANPQKIYDKERFRSLKGLVYNKFFENGGSFK